jgi:hypothetical protein
MAIVPPFRPEVDCVIDFPTCNVPMLIISQEEIDRGVANLLGVLSDPAVDTISLLATRLVRSEIYLHRLYSLLNNTARLSFSMRPYHDDL